MLEVQSLLRYLYDADVTAFEEYIHTTALTFGKCIRKCIVQSQCDDDTHIHV